MSLPDPGKRRRAASALLCAVRANEIGYPQPASLVARTLALLPAQDSFFNSAQQVERTKVKLAAELALIDVPSAYHLLCQVKTPQEVIKQGHPNRDLLFAVALADPTSGIKVIDQLIDLQLGKSQSKERNSLISYMGIPELSSTLQAKDPLSDLLMWVTLTREISTIE